MKSGKPIVPVLLSLVAVCGILAGPARSQSGVSQRWSSTFPAEEFTNTGSTPYFVLEPGYTLELTGEDNGATAVLTIPVLDETKLVDGVETRVVEERQVDDGELVEVALNYFVIGTRTGTVYYFGENVDNYANGEVINHNGTWLSGVDGARYGVLLPGLFLLGSRYYQEVAPGIALDRAENVSSTELVETPAGTFVNCLKVRETTPLEPSVKDFKYYAPGIGLVQSNKLVLTGRSSRDLGQ